MNEVLSLASKSFEKDLLEDLSGKETVIVLCMGILASVAVYAMQHDYTGEFKIGDLVDIRLDRY